MCTLLNDATKSFYRSGSKSYVFKGLTLSLKADARLCLIGPNGCGKSTLIRVILGLEYLDHGVCRFVPTREDLAAAVMQDYRSQLLPWASARTNLTLPLQGSSAMSISENQLIKTATTFLHEMGLTIPLDQQVGALSGGQQQALSLARSAAFSPRLWLLDEPINALDLSKRSKACALISRHCKGRSGLFVTHDLDDALRLGTELMVFDSMMKVVARVEIKRQEGISDAEFLRSQEATRVRTSVWSALEKGETLVQR